MSGEPSFEGSQRRRDPLTCRRQHFRVQRTHADNVRFPRSNRRAGRRRLGFGFIRPVVGVDTIDVCRVLPVGQYIPLVFRYVD
uniref:Uncharacterized protein n=1 Tax=Burkholderia orbicola (strain AU 1054) TaxID=331271 RepID=A0A0H2XL18_BURO1